jgi:hypothetical protein
MDIIGCAGELINFYLISNITDITNNYLYMDPVVIELKKFNVFSNISVKRLEKIANGLSKLVFSAYKGLNNDTIDENEESEFLGGIESYLDEQCGRDLPSYDRVCDMIFNANQEDDITPIIEKLRNLVVYTETEDKTLNEIIIQIINKIKNSDIYIKMI